MAKFDYMEFGYDAGSFDQLVFHANKYTKEQAVEIFNSEYSHEGLRCSIDNVDFGFVKYFIRPTQFMSSLKAVVMVLQINKSVVHFQYG